jgi:hypothetical protein
LVKPPKDQKKPPDILERIYWTTTTGYDWTGYTDDMKNGGHLDTEVERWLANINKQSCKTRSMITDIL